MANYERNAKIWNSGCPHKVTLTVNNGSVNNTDINGLRSFDELKMSVHVTVLAHHLTF